MESPGRESAAATSKLFSYGTLQQEAVQLDNFGRCLDGKPDALVGYKLAMIRIEDEHFVVLSGAEYHRTVQHTGLASDLVEGTVLSVTRQELEQADAYEPDGYERTLVQLRSGASAWVYANTGQGQGP